jgi:hypothetical protein
MNDEFLRITNAIRDPPNVLTKNGIRKKKAVAELPMKYLAIGKASNPPIIPVPITSPIQASSCFLNLEYKIPASKAPIILPGKASNEPVPIIFLSREIIKALLTA